MIVCIILTVLIILAFPNDSGIKGYEWMPIAACLIAIIFGIVLLCCCKINADRLSWRKRLLMYNVLEDIELLNLKNTPLGIRPGKEGAWIELGSLASVGSLDLTKTSSDPATFQPETMLLRPRQTRPWSRLPQFSSNRPQPSTHSNSRYLSSIKRRQLPLQSTLSSSLFRRTILSKQGRWSCSQ